MAVYGPPPSTGPRSRRPLEAGLIVVVGLTLLAGLLALRARPNGAVASVSASSTSAASLSLSGPSASLAAGGLQMTVQVPTGPYFLRELLAVRMTLANHSQTTYYLAGAPEANGCGSALSAVLSGGGSPTYDFPAQPVFSCPSMMSTLAPGRQLTIVVFIPVTASGRVTLSAQTYFLADVDGNIRDFDPIVGPFTHGWPSLPIEVTPQVPVAHTITLAAANGRLRITAPSGASAHLYYIFILTCGDIWEPAASMSTNGYWRPISTTMLTQPSCSGSKTSWHYSVAAPGYAIASGELDTP